MFRSLRARLSAIFIGFLLLVAASVAATFWAVQTQAADATVINLAGRQRMLSQRLLWLSLASSDQQLIDQPAQLFDRTLQALRTGGTTQDAANRPIELPPPPDEALRAQLDEAAADWAVGQAGSQVRLLQSLARYQLPQVPLNVTEAMRGSLCFWEVADYDISIPL
jgi:nitrate/nitrite-specific signal transduction histidine kinase